jgi:hypothetical protein
MAEPCGRRNGAERAALEDHGKVDDPPHGAPEGSAPVHRLDISHGRVHGLPRGGGVLDGHGAERRVGIDQRKLLGQRRAGSEDLSDQVKKRSDAIVGAEKPGHLEIAARGMRVGTEERVERGLVIGQPGAVEPRREAERFGPGHEDLHQVIAADLGGDGIRLRN